MSIHTQTINSRNIAYPVTDNFVRIGNVAYPITHSFVVGERWIEDPNAPAILECYNFIYTPPEVPIFTHFSTGSNFRASMIHSFSNYPIITEHDRTQGPFSIQLLQETSGPEYDLQGHSGLDYVYYGIGYYSSTEHDRTGSILPIIPPVKTITTQSWRSPHVGTIYRPDPDFPDWVIVGDGWFSNEGWSNSTSTSVWGTDFVMWVYDWEWSLDGEHRSFDPLASLTDLPWGVTNFGINDGLFLTGQRGARVISRRFWDAPWERYPHL